MTDKMLQEIQDIPTKAQAFLRDSPAYTLPLHVPYLGMGSSYFAPLAFKYIGVPIYPEIASEYFNYLADLPRADNAVILSQSGRSSEALWTTKMFKSYVAVTNNLAGPLSQNPAVSQTVDLLAEDEQYSSSKTYVNTLLALFKGFGFDASDAVATLVKNIPNYAKLGEEIATQIYELITTKKIHGIYIIGSGPNVATAYQAALILSESAKISFTGMPTAQYDHGPKETAVDSIVIQILSKGASYERGQKLASTIAQSGAHVFTVEEPEAEEKFSVLHNIVPFNYIAYNLAQKLNITETFVVGGKVTEVL
jgi:glutamine---fructose-6-phosphate transaminase (isomerizing)